MGNPAPDPEPLLPQPARLWTVAEANHRLAQLAELLPRLRTWATRLGEVQGEVERLGAFWGKELDASDHVDHERKEQLDAEWQHLTHRLEEAVGALQREGIEVKDLSGGLVDFYGLVDGEVVFLCWRLGEGEVGFYHRLDGGYRTRRPIPETARATLSSPRDAN
ncbi:MAG TPA: DUF2203 domain-containing protein [Thermoplasmata archaeon]|nr:DUF2203 domain-containing protein [Thermoplasmata archaeon]